MIHIIKSILSITYLVIFFLVAIGGTVALYILDSDPLDKVGGYILGYTMLLFFLGLLFGIIHFITLVVLWVYKHIVKLL